MGWGLGVIVVRRPQTVTSMLRPGTFGHGGAFGTQGWMDVERDMFLIYLVARANFPDNSDSSPLRGIFQQIAVDAIER